MAHENILVIEDEEDIAELIRYNLEREGYRIVHAESGERGLDIVRRQHPDLLLLDLMLPGIDGLEVCKRVKADAAGAQTPIIMVTARGEEADVVTGLELGAEDYLTKPFSPRVLVARVRAVLRRRNSAPVADDAVIRTHGIEIHPGRHEVTIDGTAIDLTATEFKILHFLAKRPGWVFTRYQIVDGIRGPNYPVTERSVDVQVVALRRKLAERGEAIETVRGVGYRFSE
jgi:two-component system alkaline phosphatase synthesis response regulator PhoP